METHREQHRWYWWRGRVDEILRLTSVARKLINSVKPDDQPQTDVSGAVHFDGRDVDLKSVQTLAGLVRKGEFEQMQSATIFIGQSNHGVQVCLGLQRQTLSPAVSLSVYGSNAIGVGGVAKQLRQEIDKGRRRVAWPPLRPITLVLVSTWIAAVGIVLALAWSRAAGIVAVALSVLMFLAGTAMHFVVPRIVPPLEFISPNEPATRADLLLGRVKAAGLFVLGATVSAIVFIFVDRLL